MKEIQDVLRVDFLPRPKTLWDECEDEVDPAVMRLRVLLDQLLIETHEARGHINSPRSVYPHIKKCQLNYGETKIYFLTKRIISTLIRIAGVVIRHLFITRAILGISGCPTKKLKKS